MAANTAAGYDSTAGAGGKFRKKPFRKSQTTPYDRPITALRPAQVDAKKNGWISKLVEPASRLITSSAHKLFSSVFRKRLLPPPNPSTNSPGEIMEMVNGQPQAAAVAIPAATQETIVGGVDNPSRNSDGDGMAELEDILKQKTFTRSEIDQLTVLLLSRTADNSAVNEKSSGPKNSDQQAIDYSYEDRTNVPTQENMVKHVVPGAISTPAMKPKVLEDVASPAELAKAYMGSRPRQVSPSMLGLNNQMSRECVSTANNPPFKARSPVTSLLQKPFSDVGTSENGFVTPRYRGKSAIYCMARTPYSRIHPATTFKDPDSTMGAQGGSLFSRKAIENDQLNGSKKQVLKRRSSVLENDIGSVGPIRRIRQKPNLLHPKVLTLPSSDGTRSTHVYGASSDATEIPSSSNWNSHSHSFSKSISHNTMPGTSSVFVPSQSIETAQKIFQQLDKFTPKGESPDFKIDIGGGTSPKRMTSTMRGSPTHRSTETADALKVSQSRGDRRKENAPQNSASHHDPPSKISLMVEEASLKKAEVPSDDRSPEVGVEVRMPNSKASHDIKVADEDPGSSLDQPPKKRAFQMSAHEDYLEPDDDVQLNGLVSNPLSEGEANTGSAKKSVAILDVPSQNEKPAVAEQKSSHNSLLSRKDPELISNGPVTTSNATGFSFPDVSPSSPATSMGVPATANTRPPALASEDIIAKDKLPTLVFSTTSSTSESAIQKDTKLEFPNSLVASSNNLVSIANGFAEKDTKSTQGSAGEVKKSAPAAPAPAADTTKGPFSFGLHVSKQSLDNGVPSTIPATSTSSTPNLFSSSFAKQSPPVTSSVPSFLSGSISFSNGFASSASTSSTAAPSGSTTNSIANLSPSSSQLPSSVTASSVSSAPIFQFGTSIASSTSAASAVVSADNSGAKSSEMAFSNTTSSSLFSPVTSTGGSGIFGFNASTVKSANSEGQTAAPAASSGSIFGFQASSSTTPASTSMPSFPTQSSSSTSTTSVFAFGAATTPSSGLFSSGAASVVNPAAAASAVSSSSGTTSNSIFSTNWQQPSKPSFPTFSTTSSSTGFSFGGSATGTSTEANKTAVAFGSTNSSSSTGFSFGASPTGTSTEANKNAVAFGSTNSSSSPAGNSSPFVFGGMTNTSTSPVFSFGGNTISSTPTSTPAAPSQPAFGNNVSTPTFGFGSTPPGNGDQMSLEDSMAEDSMQPSIPTPVFGQPQTPAPAPASGSFVFGQTPSTGFGGSAAPPSTGNPFAFGNQPNQMATPSPSPFQPSGSVEFNAGGAGSFSLGAGGDKGGRKYVKPRRLPKRK